MLVEIEDNMENEYLQISFQIIRYSSTLGIALVNPSNNFMGIKNGTYLGRKDGRATDRCTSSVTLYSAQHMQQCVAP
jgi:hypothetical protein